MLVGLQFYAWLPPPGNMFILLLFLLLLLLFLLGKKRFLWQKYICKANSVCLSYIISTRACLTSSVYVYVTPDELATGWTVRGSNPGGFEFFHMCLDRPWGPPSLLYNGYRVFPGCKEGPGRDADPSPPSSAVVMKEYSYTSIPLMRCTACTEPQCL